MTVQNDLDPFDDWSVALANVKSLAKVARDAGLVGIVVDDESLSGLRVNYPYDFRNGGTKTEAEYRAQSQSIGRQIMSTIVAEFPDAVVVVLRGGAGVEPKSSPTLVNCVSRDVANAQPNDGCGANPASSLGSFFAGFRRGRIDAVDAGRRRLRLRPAHRRAVRRRGRLAQEPASRPRPRPACSCPRRCARRGRRS